MTNQTLVKPNLKIMWDRHPRVRNRKVAVRTFSPFFKRKLLGCDLWFLRKISSWWRVEYNAKRKQEKKKKCLTLKFKISQRILYTYSHQIEGDIEFIIKHILCGESKSESGRPCYNFYKKFLLELSTLPSKQIFSQVKSRVLIRIIVIDFGLLDDFTGGSSISPLYRYRGTFDYLPIISLPCHHSRTE